MRKRVLYVIQHRDYSGAETSQEVVIRSDPEALVACPADSPTERFARDLGAETTPIVFQILRHSGGLAETVRSLFRGLRGAAGLRDVLKLHPDRETVYAIGFRAGLLAALATLGTGRRVVWSVTDLLPPWPLRPLIRLIAWARVRRHLCLSEFIAEDLVGRSRRLRGRTVVVNPGVPIQRFAPGGTEPGAPLAAAVGHISHVKRTDLAVEVAARILHDEPEFRLRLVGSAQFNEQSFAFERELRERVQRDQVTRGAIEFLGRQSDVPAALSGCGVLLHCRPDEPLGMVLVEAMALGLPVVAPRAGGPLELVEEGVTGLLFPPGDADAAAECVVRLIRDVGLARRMGSAARARVEERFTDVRQLEQTRKVLAELR